MFGGDKKADCPFWRAPCKEHGCRFWVQLQGQNPNTGQPVTEWNCAIAFLPILLIENSQQMRQAGASTDKVANEVKKFHDGMAAQNRELHQLMLDAPKGGDDV